MDTEVETLPSKSTRQEGYVEAKHCLCIELLPDVNERATRIFAPQVRVSDHMLDSVLCIKYYKSIDYVRNWAFMSVVSYRFSRHVVIVIIMFVIQLLSH